MTLRSNYALLYHVIPLSLLTEWEDWIGKGNGLSSIHRDQTKSKPGGGGFPMLRGRGSLSYL